MPAFVKHTFNYQSLLKKTAAAQSVCLHKQGVLWLALFFSFVFAAQAQFPNPLNFNTATNATNSGTLSVGANDLHWSVAVTNSVGPYAPAVSCGNPIPATWVNSPFPNTNWICPPRNCGPSPAQQCIAIEDDYYKLSFSLPPTICGEPITAAYCLGLNFYADNCVSEIYVNGVLSYTNPVVNPYGDHGYAAGHGLTASLCNNWQSGNNDVIVHIKSGPSYGGFLAQVSQTIVTAPYTPLSATASQTNSSCSNPFSTAMISMAGGMPPYTYTWMPMGGNSFVANNLTTGTYSCVVRDINNCAYIQTFSISNTTQPATVSAGATATICSGASVTLNASGAGSYTWMPGHLTGSVISVSPFFSQTYSVLASNGNCTATATQSVIVNPLPAVAVHVSGLAALCYTTSAVMSVSGTGSYTWLPGNYSGSDYSVTITASQNYTVIGYDGKCYSSAVQHLTVNTPPHISIGVSSLTLCAGEERPIAPVGADDFQWTPAVAHDTNEVFTIHPIENTTYTITGYNGLCAGDTKTLSVTVHSVNAAFTDDAEHATTTDAISFQNLSSPDAGYSWYFSWGETSQEKDPVVTISDPGTYVACLLVKNNYGCMDTACKTIRVSCPEEAVFIPNTFTPNDDGLNDLFKVVTLPSCIEQFNLSLFNRWGDKVFSSDKLDDGWDGKIKGTDVKEDVYVYVAEYTMSNKKSYKRTGHFMLMK